jgi:hypothetical protein
MSSRLQFDFRQIPDNYHFSKTFLIISGTHLGSCLVGTGGGLVGTGGGLVSTGGSLGVLGAVWWVPGAVW